MPLGPSGAAPGDRKSTRLNSSHSQISYAVFCLKKKMTRTHARAPIGQRAVVSEPFNPGSKLSVISALRLGGICAPMMIEGAFNSEIFDLYVEHMLLPGLRPGTIIVVDNIKFHYSARAIALI